MPRIDEIDDRLREVEAAVVELATMARMMKLLVAVVAASLGVEITGIGV
jgi:hypothetical protein